MVNTRLLAMFLAVLAMPAFADVADDAIRLSNSGVSEEVVSAWADNQHDLTLSANDIVKMKEGKVPDKFILVLLRATSGPQTTVQHVQNGYIETRKPAVAYASQPAASAQPAVQYYAQPAAQYEAPPVQYAAPAADCCPPPATTYVAPTTYVVPATSYYVGGYPYAYPYYYGGYYPWYGGVAFNFGFGGRGGFGRGGFGHGGRR